MGSLEWVCNEKIPGVHLTKDEGLRGGGGQVENKTRRHLDYTFGDDRNTTRKKGVQNPQTLKRVAPQFFRRYKRCLMTGV